MLETPGMFGAGRLPLTLLVPLSLMATACGPSGRLPSTGSTATTGPPLAHPSVTVAPSSALTAGQQVHVHVSGFEIARKVYLSECSSATAPNRYGCGEQLAAQPFITTDETRNGSGTFTVEPTAAGKPYDIADASSCTANCVLLDTNGSGGGSAFAPLGFAG
jgi:hypothetical protein